MRIVLLMGPSSAGKTTLCAELKKQHHWQVVSGDEVNERIWQELEKKYKQELMTKLREEKQVISELKKYMHDEQIYRFCTRGSLVISKNGQEHKHQFPDPDLPNLKQILENAKLDKNEIESLASSLISATKVDKAARESFQKQNPLPDSMEVAFNEAFSCTDPNATIILDLIPGERGMTNKYLDSFKQHGDNYRKQHGNQSLQTFSVLAYCSPQSLSARVKQRNLEAERDNNPRNKREGLFPFHQLGEVIKAGEENQFTKYGTVSRDDLFDISSTHIKSFDDSRSIFLENPVDPNALKLKPTGNNDHPRFNKDNASTVKLDLSKDDDLTIPMNSERPRIGTRETIKEYGRLAAKFGFLNDNQEKGSLSIAPGLQFDAVINMEQGDPNSLVVELMRKIEAKTSQDRKLHL